VSRHPGLPKSAAFLVSFAAPFLLLALMMLLISGMSHPPAFAAPADSPPDRENHPASLPQSGPQADFSASPRAGSAPLAVQFTDRSTGTIEARLWSFGDGATATVASPVHTYTLAGLYTPTLTVWSGGISSTMSKPAHIRAGVVKPEVTFSGVTADSTDVAFNGQNELLGVAAVVNVGVYGQRLNAVTGGVIGSPFALRGGAGQVDVHLAYHAAAGRYLVVWRNTSGGASDLYGQRVSGAGSLIGGNFLIQSGVRRLEVAASPVTPTFLVVWTESAGSLRARPVSTEGVVGEALGLAEGVNPDQPPAIAYGPDGAALVVWSGSDGTIQARGVLSTGVLLPPFSLSVAGAAEPAVVYDASEGHFLVVWREGAGAIKGCWAELTGPLGAPLALGEMITAARPFAALDAATGQVWVIWGSNDYDDWEIYARRVTAEGSAAGDVLPLVVNPGNEQGWNIGEAGTYGVYLTWFNASTIYAAGFRPLRADFTADIREGTAPLTVTFTNRSAPLGLITSHHWDFGDGVPSEEVAPTHVYTRPGRYTVSLTVEGAGQRHTETKVEYIRVGFPYPALQVSPVYAARTLRRGEQVQVAYRVENVGTAATGPVTFSTPTAPGWVSVTPGGLPDLPPGGSATVTVTLAPPADLPVGTYRDLLRVEATGVQKAAAFSVRVVGVTRTLEIAVGDAYGPVGGAIVHLVRREESLLVTEGVTATIHEEARAQSGGDGRAVLEGLEAGAYDYTVAAPGHGAARGVVTVTAGSGPQPLAVMLEALPLLVPEPLYPELHVQPGGEGLLEGAVRNVGLGTARNVRVRLPPGAPGWLSAGVTGPAEALTGGGTLSVTFLAAPPETAAPALYRYYVDVVADNAPATRFALSVLVSGQATGTLQYQVRDPAGEPVEGARVLLVSKDGRLVVTQGVTQTVYDHFVETTDAGGAALFVGVPAGAYNVYVDARGFESYSEDPVVPPGGTLVQSVSLDRLPFQATYTVQETQIPDVYRVTVTLAFASGLQVLPLALTAPCEGGPVQGFIQVRNPYPFPVTNVQISGEAPGVAFQIENLGATIGPGQIAQFPFTAQVAAYAYGRGRLRVWADGVASSWSPVKVETCTAWTWHWTWDGTGAIGMYAGPYPSFPFLDPPPFHGPSTIQLELSQSAVLERQAFLAELTLSNPQAELTDLEVCITARDAQGVLQPTHFVITPTVPTRLPDLAPGMEPVHQQWLIVPVYQGLTEPTTYTLRATLTFRQGEETYTVESLPAMVLVQPQPEVHLQYFVPRYVRAGEPVLLGVRAINRGAGAARNLHIASTYPRIVSQSGEPISFEMLGTLENGALRPGDMELNFGDIAPGQVVTGGWVMRFSHHGQFTHLGVRCQHLDYQGLALSNILYCDGGENIFSNDLQHLNGDECPDQTTCDKQGCIGGPINTRSGNYGYKMTDLSIPTAGSPLVMERSYNSTNVLSDTDTLGPGWTHRYAMRLEFPDLSGQVVFPVTTGDEVLDRSALYYRPYLLVRLPGGSRLRLADNGDGTYTPYPGSRTRMFRHESGGVVTYTLIAPDETTRIFDGTGRLLLIRDRHGNETRLTYDGAGRLTRVTDPSGQRWLEFGYDEAGRLAWVRDPLSRTVRYGYDPAGDLVVVTDTRGLVWTYVYTGSHLLHEVRDPLGNIVERTFYDAASRAVRQENGAGVAIELEYDGDETHLWEAGRETVHRYDLFGALVEEVDAAGHEQGRAYNWDFRPEQTTDALGRVTRMEWNSCCGQLSVITDSLGNATRMEYDGRGNLLWMTDAAGHTTRYEYDAQNNLIAQTDALGRVTRYAYDAYGHVISTTDPLGNTTLYGYDEFGQRVVVTDALGNVTTYGYDAAGRLITVTNAAGQVTLNEYDAADHLIRTVQNYLPGYPQNWLDTYNLVTEYEYDGAGRQVAMTDTLGHVTRSEYDGAGRLIRTIQNFLPGYPQNDQNAYNLVTEYGYDAAGNPILVTDTLGNVTYTEYDELNRVKRVWRNYRPGYPQNYYDAETHTYYNLVTEYGYDAVGNQILVTDTLGNVTYTEYDELNRVRRTQDAGGRITTYEYDAVGNQIRVTDHASRVTFYEYDALHRPVTVTTNYVDGVYDPSRPDEDLVRITTYDAAGRIQNVTDHASRITYYTNSVC